MKNITLLGLAYQNLRRKPYRALLIGASVALATGALFAITIVMFSIETSLTVGQARLGADLVVVPEGNEVSAQESFITGRPSTFYMNHTVGSRVAEINGVAQASPQVYVQTLSNASCCVGEFFLVGYDPATDFTINPWLVNHLNKEAIQPEEVVVGDRILLGPGETALFYGTQFTVVGVLEKTGMGIDRTIYIPVAGMRQMIAASGEKAIKTLTVSEDEISAVLVKVDPGVDELDVAERIEHEIQGVQVFTASQLNKAVDRQIQGVLGIVISITAALWIMSLMMIGLVFSLVVNERQRELGLLRAMGATKGLALRLVLSEAAFLTGISSLIGLTSTLILLLSFARLIQLRLHIPYLMPPTANVIAIALGLWFMAVVAGALSSLLPALSSSRMDVYEAIRQGE